MSFLGISRIKSTAAIAAVLIVASVAGWWLFLKPDGQAAYVGRVTADERASRAVARYEKMRTKEPFLDDFLGSVSRRIYRNMKTQTGGMEARRYYTTLYDRAILTLAAEIEPGQDMAVALRPYFQHWTADYVRLVQYIRKHGYIFKSMADYAPDDDAKKIVYMRHDIHLRDVPGALGFMDVNHALGVEADYYLLWEHSSREQRDRDVFRLLTKLRKRGDHFGLHAAPAASWLALEFNNGDWSAYKKFMRSDAFREYMANPDNRNELRQEAMGRLKELYQAFESEFGEVKIAAAHGSLFNSRVRELCKQGKLTKDALDLTSTKLLSDYTDQHPGLLRESYQFAGRNNLGYVSDNQRDQRRFWENLDKALAAGRSIMILLHPAVIHRAEMSLARP